MLTDTEIEEELRPFADHILRHETFLFQKNFIQHSIYSVYSHELHVAHFALGIDEALKIGCDRKKLVCSALLHDYFLYDWHIGGEGDIHPRLHGFYHPGTALSNADRDFDLSDEERDAIKKHMWPLTVIPPRYREAWVVTLADKQATVWEKINMKKSQNENQK